MQNSETKFGKYSIGVGLHLSNLVISLPQENIKKP
jgi:hypothetical protein